MAVVEALDIVEDGTAGRCPRGPRLAVDELTFEGGEETLRHGVVPTVRHSAHGGHQPGRLQTRPKAREVYWQSFVRRGGLPGRRPPGAQGHGGVASSTSSVRRWSAMAPPDDASAEGIEHGGQIEPAFAGRDVRDVQSHSWSGASGLKCRTRLGARRRGSAIVVQGRRRRRWHPASPAWHQAAPPACARSTPPARKSACRRGAVGAPARVVQPGQSGRSARRRLALAPRAPVTPGIEARPGHAQDTARERHRVAATTAQ